MGTDSRADHRRRGFLVAVREVILIVLGVLIALWLESFWQDRADRAAERQLLSSLRDEFARNQQPLNRWVELHESVIVSARGFIALLEAADSGDMMSVPDSLIADMARTPTYEPDLNRLDAARNSGQFSLVRSPEVQASLASWTRLLADAQEEEEKAAQLVYRDLLPALGTTTDLGPAMDWLSTAARGLMRGEPRAERQVTSSDLVVTEELRNLLWVRFRLASASASELQILRNALDDVLARLDAELQ